MFDDREQVPRPPRSEVDALLRAQDWADLTKRLTAYAFSRTRSRDQARDLVQNAMMRAFDAGRHVGWNPAAKPILHYLMGEVNSLLATDRKHRRKHRELAMSPDEGASAAEQAIAREAERVVSAAPAADERMAAEQRRKQRWGGMRSWFEARDDGAALRVLDLFEQGIDAVAEQARASGLTPKDVERARERLFHRARQSASKEDA